MTALLKSFGKGLLYILVLPVLLVVLAVYIVVGVVIFIYIGLKAVILFFTGRNLSELPEDIKAREILEGKKPTPTLEETKEEAPVLDNFASHYYVPINQDVPSNDTNPSEDKDNGGEVQ